MFNFNLIIMCELDLIDLGFSHCQDVDDYVYRLTDNVRLRCELRRLRAHVWIESRVGNAGVGVDELVYMSSFSRVGLTKLIMVCNILKV